MNIETERLYLRDFCKEDAGDLQEILGDAETMKNLEPPYSAEKTEEFLNDFCIKKKGAVAAVEKGQNKVIGYILFNGNEHGVYEIGWAFNKNYWGRGYAYEACSKLIENAFLNFGAHKIFAETIDKEKSVRLMEKLGMHQEGLQKKQVKDSGGDWRDLYLYGILKEDMNFR